MDLSKKTLCHTELFRTVSGAVYYIVSIYNYCHALLHGVVLKSYTRCVSGISRWLTHLIPYAYLLVPDTDCLQS
jgi:hypothetical protein